MNHNEEMVKRSLIIAAGNSIGTEKDGPFNESFVSDRGKLWDLISTPIIKKEASPYIKCYRTSHYGIKTMLEYHDHFLGPNTVNHIQKQAKQKLLSISYWEVRKNWNFGRFLSVQKEQHTILEGFTDHGCCRLDERRKVTRLLDEIKTDSLDAVKANIMQDRKLRRDFEKCVTFYNYFIKHSSGNQSNELRIIDEVSSYKKGNNGVKQRYYSKEDYKKLSTNAKKKFRKHHKGYPQGGSP